ncbi:uncharacterized protein VTP21DRAFT_10986 [Calcarisporiella thermophila]|uniref:uncharacterized protein n=1 Tax=Calcarisporiella thermophila TaxID=911321 RepID=UPI00374479AA
MDPRKRATVVFAKSMGQCSSQATAYGMCVTSKLEEVRKDLCAAEFQAFKNCVQKAVSDRVFQ